MGMYPTKNCSEDALMLDAKWLKDHDYLCGWKSGGIKWTGGWGNWESNISFVVDTGNKTIRLYYTIDKDTEDEIKIDYSLPLIKVPCNLGGFRWAFRCTLYSSGIYCGRIVYSLYKANADYFGCRHCAKIVYQSQRWSGKKYAWLGRAFSDAREIEELEKSITKSHYKGSATKKVMRLRKLENEIPPVPSWLKL